MSKLKQYKLGDLAEITSSKRIFFADYVPEGIPFFRSKEIIERSLGESGGEPLYIAKEKYFEIKEKFGAPVDGDLLISAVGERAGIPFVVKNQGDFYFKDGNLIWFRNIKPELNTTYLNYWIKSSIGQSTLENIMIGSAQKALTIIGLKNLIVELPNAKYQQKVVDTLISIDNKLNLLQSQVKLLETLGETIFRSLFELDVSQGDLVSLNDYVNCINGVSYKSSELEQSKVGMVSLKSFDRNGGFSIDGFKEFTGKFKDKQIVIEGDLIVAHTDITQEAEVIGNPALVIDNPNFDTMTISMDIVKVVSKIEWVSNEFLYYLMKTREFKSHCQGCANGSTVLHLNKQAIPTFEFPKPKPDKVLEFTKQSRELLNKVFSNHKQLRNLVLLRDNLLPKLMNGTATIEI